VFPGRFGLAALVAVVACSCGRWPSRPPRELVRRDSAQTLRSDSGGPLLFLPQPGGDAPLAVRRQAVDPAFLRAEPFAEGLGVLLAHPPHGMVPDPFGDLVAIDGLDFPCAVDAWVFLGVG